jgi:polyhydroxybutyrate depolymerase
MKTNWIRQVGAAIAAASLTASPAAAGTLDEENTISTADGPRYFHSYVPDGMAPNPAVVFLLHGGTQGYDQMVSGQSAPSEWLSVADDHGFLLIVPNGIDPATGDPNGNEQNWNDCRSDAGNKETGADDVAFIGGLIDWAIATHSIDTDRVYATGASNGGMMSYRLARELSDRIAAVASIVANTPANSECTGPVEPVSVLVMNGTADTLSPWNGGSSAEGWGALSATQTRDFWIDHNGAGASASESIAYDDSAPGDGSVARSDLHTGGADGTEVMFYTIQNGGHQIPSIAYPVGLLARWLLGPQNNDIEAAREAWAFLSQHTLGGSAGPGPVTLFSDGFESGDFSAGGWSTSGSPIVSGSAAYVGSMGARVRRTSSITKAVSTAGHSSVRLRYVRRTRNLDDGEKLFVEWSVDGSSWNEVESFEDSGWVEKDFVLPAGAANQSGFRVRFRTHANGWAERADVDDVVVIGE